jgi:hypothetical protein
MAKNHKPALVPLQFGPLPVRTINKTLSLDLEDGDVRLSINAQKHATTRHPEDYARCLPHVAQVVSNPLFIGDDIKNDGSIELIGRVPALGASLLVAVSLTKSEDGHYDILSFYPVSEQKIEGRVKKGFLSPAQKH